MIVYNHKYCMHYHKLIIEPIEVTETPKMVKSKKGELGNYCFVFTKEKFDTLIYGIGEYYMVSDIPNKLLFIKMIKTDQEQHLSSLKENIIMREDEIANLNKLIEENNRTIFNSEEDKHD